jgi:hypothetical protein
MKFRRLVIVVALGAGSITITHRSAKVKCKSKINACDKYSLTIPVTESGDFKQDLLGKGANLQINFGAPDSCTKSSDTIFEIFGPVKMKITKKGTVYSFNGTPTANDDPSGVSGKQATKLVVTIGSGNTGTLTASGKADFVGQNGATIAFVLRDFGEATDSDSDSACTTVAATQKATRD